MEAVSFHSNHYMGCTAMVPTLNNEVSDATVLVVGQCDIPDVWTGATTGSKGVGWDSRLGGEVQIIVMLSQSILLMWWWWRHVLFHPIKLPTRTHDILLSTLLLHSNHLRRVCRSSPRSPMETWVLLQVIPTNWEEKEEDEEDLMGGTNALTLRFLFSWWTSLIPLIHFRRMPCWSLALSMRIKLTPFFKLHFKLRKLFLLL